MKKTTIAVGLLMGAGLVVSSMGGCGFIAIRLPVAPPRVVSRPPTPRPPSLRPPAPRIFSSRPAAAPTPASLATASSTAGITPLKQTSGNYTLQITSGSWVGARFTEEPSAKALRLDYNIQPASRGKKLNPRLYYMRSVSMIGPHGERIGGGSGNYQYALLAADPRWDKATADFELQDPDAPREVAGPFEDVLKFRNVRIPQRLNKVLTVNRSITTERGDRFTLEKVRVRMVKQEKGGMVRELAFSLKQQQKPGMTMSLGMGLGVYARAIKVRARGGPEQTIWNNGDPTFDNDLPDSRVFFVRSLTGHPHRLTIQIHIEQTPQVLPRKWYRHFRVNLDLSKIPLPPPSAAAVAAPAGTIPAASAAASKTVKGKIADVEVEQQLVRTAEHSTPPLLSYNARVWIRDKQQDTVLPYQRAWMFKDPKMRWMRGGHELESEFSVPHIAGGGNGELYWKADGTAARPDETGLVLGGFASREPRIKSITYQLTLEAVHKYAYTLSFKGIPVPKRGQVLHPNLIGTLPGDARASGIKATGARLVLSKISYFPDEASWRTLPRRRRGQPQSPRGLCAVFTLERSSEGSNGDLAILGLNCRDMTDNKGRTVLQPLGDVASRWDGFNREQPKRENYNTFVLLPPKPGARRFDMLVEASEIISTGQREKFVLPDIPVPQK